MIFIENPLNVMLSLHTVLANTVNEARSIPVCGLYLVAHPSPFASVPLVAIHSQTVSILSATIASTKIISFWTMSIESPALVRMIVSSVLVIEKSRILGGGFLIENGDKLVWPTYTLTAISRRAIPQERVSDFDHRSRFLIRSMISSNATTANLILILPTSGPKVCKNRWKITIQIVPRLAALAWGITQGTYGVGNCGSQRKYSTTHNTTLKNSRIQILRFRIGSSQLHLGKSSY